MLDRKTMLTVLAFVLFMLAAAIWLVGHMKRWSVMPFVPPACVMILVAGLQPGIAQEAADRRKKKALKGGEDVGESFPDEQQGRAKQQIGQLPQNKAPSTRSIYRRCNALSTMNCWRTKMGTQSS